MLPIGPKEKRFALESARTALEEFLDRGLIPEFATSAPCLLEHRGSFVTLRDRESGELRGCRGECRPNRPLIESVIHQAISSATDDSRFPCVSVAEVPHLTIRISALTPLHRIATEEIVLGRHGLLIVQGRRSGLLLPEVSRRFGLNTPEEFLEALFHKAGIDPAQAPRESFELYAFETEAWDDENVTAASSC